MKIKVGRSLRFTIAIISPRSSRNNRWCK